jgi:hypothetical protein
MLDPTEVITVPHLDPHLIPKSGSCLVYNKSAESDTKYRVFITSTIPVRSLCCVGEGSCYLLVSVANPHHVDADPDSACHFDADPNPARHFDADPNPAYNFDANPDPAYHFVPDPACHLDEDPDPAYHFECMRI